MTSKTRVRGIATAKMLLGLILLLLLLLWNDNAARLVDILARLDLRYLVILFAIGVLSRVARVVRWQAILRDRGSDLPFARLFSLHLIGQFFSNFMPSMIGGDLAKVYLLGRQIKSQSRSAASVVVDRFTGMAAMILLALSFTTMNPELTREPLVGLSVGLITLGSIAFLLLFLNARSLPLKSAVLGVFPGARALVRSLVILYDEILAYRRRYGVLLRALFYSILYYFLASLGIYFGCRAIGLEPLFLDVAVVTPIAYLLMAVPVSPNNVGWWEWTLSLLLGGAGATMAEGLTVALVIRFVATLLSLLGGVLFLLERVDHSNDPSR